jgi:hypothetical protein
MKILIADNNTDLTERQFGEARVVIAGGKVVKDNLGCHDIDDSGSITLQLPPYVEAKLPESVMSDLTHAVCDAIEKELDTSHIPPDVKTGLGLPDHINIPLTELMARVSNELQARQS